MNLRGYSPGGGQWGQPGLLPKPPEPLQINLFGEYTHIKENSKTSLRMYTTIAAILRMDTQNRKSNIMAHAPLSSYPNPQLADNIL